MENSILKLLESTSSFIVIEFREYGSEAPYVAMRLLPAIMGILVVPIIFLTLRSSGCTQLTSLLGSILIIFENGLVTQSRLILLDSPLVIATAFTAYAWIVFESKYHNPALSGGSASTSGTPSPADNGVFSAEWWMWLLLTGLGLGVTVSMKWVGLFTIAWVGSLTLLQLWNLLGDLRVTPVSSLFNGVNGRGSGLNISLLVFCVLLSFLLDFTWPCSLFISFVL
jgi:dolichyl-phosphate-mannose-protein mannosyltransferase